MAAHSFLKIGGLWLFAYREWYSEALAAMFRDDENVASLDAPVYSLPAGDLRARLSVLGFTSEVARSTLEKSRAALIEAENQPDDFPPFEDWLSANLAAVTDDEVMGEDVPDWTIWIDHRITVCRILDYVDPDVDVSLDLTDVVIRGHVQPSNTRCADARAQDRTASVGPLVVITEGSSDAEAISGALDVILPHLSGFVRFLDYTLKPEGSTAALVRAVRAFAAAGISNQVIALFDNDTAAAEALTSLDVTQLPPNFRVLQLPDIDLARCYPTIGPSGPQDMDINGLAASVELFFGADVLRDGEALTPVQWTGYSTKMSAYQGEILAKAAIQAKFRDKLRHARENGTEGQDWTEMTRLLEAISSAFD